MLIRVVLTMSFFLLTHTLHAAPPNILFCIADDWGAHAGPTVQLGQDSCL